MTMEEYIVERCVKLECINKELKEENEVLKEDNSYQKKNAYEQANDYIELAREIIEVCKLTNFNNKFIEQLDSKNYIEIYSTNRVSKEDHPLLYKILHNEYISLCNQSKE